MKNSILPYFVSKGETTLLNENVRQHLRGNFVRLSQGITHYELTGPSNGEIVLLFPGMTIPLFYWDDFIAYLHQQGLQTLAYSAYGRGYSDRVRAIYDIDLFVNQSIELLNTLGMNKVDHVIGTSLGALMAMEFLNRQVFPVKTLTLIGPAGLNTSEPLAAHIAKSKTMGKLFGTYLGHQSILKHLKLNVYSEKYKKKLLNMVADAFTFQGSVYAVLATLRSLPLINQQTAYNNISHLKIPTLLLWGKEDKIISVEHYPEALELLVPNEDHIIGQCGHMAAFECPEKVAQKFIPFIIRN
ncbi:alpha/beta fold hydrolase [Chondrinema litorale]|uniref:alpha/beta fold hydrolase n=1 Tax=Chondrinema litorale TaxID=2994555 RepID=UPI002543872A|nr:alpha/beta hydrolase [Chondrinema litorale]UZR98517.1 alpha/beta hydrolase [Chondrinema litorale]